MSREIKYKCWLPGIGKMTYGLSLLDWINDSQHLELSGKEIFLQYTGLKDKNGIEIYDGDMVKRRVHLVEGQDYFDYNCEVRWNGWCYGLFVGKGDHGKQLWGLDPIVARECEVSGNIYENQVNK